MCSVKGIANYARRQREATAMKTQELRIEKALAPTVFAYVQKAADELGQDTYVIGGYVRDTFLSRSRGSDIDIVSVGSGISLAKKVAEILPGKNNIQVFKNYGTALLKWQTYNWNLSGLEKKVMITIVVILWCRMEP